MTIKAGRTLRGIRILSQILFLSIFLYLFFRSFGFIKDEFKSAGAFFYIDPLLLLTNFISKGKILTVFLFSLIPLLLTIFFGRFFCGWICPMGSINQFFSKLFKSSRKLKIPFSPEIKKIKYIILIVLLSSAFLGNNLVGLLDPVSLITRSMAAFTITGENILNRSVQLDKSSDSSVTDEKNFESETHPENIINNKSRKSTQAMIIGGVFIFLLILNKRHPRFFCNVLCPLGAIYSIVSRIGYLRMEVNSECKDCSACSKNCSYDGSPFKDYKKSDCTVCFNCVVNCPENSIQPSLKILNNSNKPLITDSGRRKAIGSIAAGIIIASLPRASVFSQTTVRHAFLRPPGAINETDFLSSCTRCGLCVQSCPTSFIQPAVLESGFIGLWTPVVNAKTGFCAWECNNCTQVCPTDSIQKLSLLQKQRFQIGTAVIDKNKCYTYSDGFNCTACEEVCPTPEKAIQFRQVEINNFEDKQVKINQIFIKPDLCTACGICEYVCPRHDSPGIFITAEDEVRERFNGI